MGTCVPIDTGIGLVRRRMQVVVVKSAGYANLTEFYPPGAHTGMKSENWF